MGDAITFQQALVFLPFIYLAAISLIAVVVTCYDKIAATKRPKHRTPEATLLFISALGGSVAMFITMQIIRHKTKHKKFMIGIPVIIVLQIVAVAAVMLLT
ncbi:MAG: DUF1294 domain-containing protein [Clostridia bacterium]|nr:DUF1294 domain-containing protein [Clostridia bacterium]